MMRIPTIPFSSAPSPPGGTRRCSANKSRRRLKRHPSGNRIAAHRTGETSGRRHRIRPVHSAPSVPLGGRLLRFPPTEMATPTRVPALRRPREQLKAPTDLITCRHPRPSVAAPPSAHFFFPFNCRCTTRNLPGEIPFHSK
jgi:hypothetical protein